ncbi:hypothetical protein Tco_1062982 [Tanacetum coccineum]
MLIRATWTYIFSPITVIKELEKLLKRFLWNSGESGRGKAKVAWSLVCSPKEQGGLGRDGKDISVWHDKWCSHGPIDMIVSKRVVYEARIADEARVADMINNDKWKWPREWEELFPETAAHLDPAVYVCLTG